MTRVNEMQPTARDQLVGVADLIRTDLIRRGAQAADADDAAQNAVTRMLERLPENEERIKNWPQHRGYFIRSGVRSWYMLLRSEQRRRVRQESAFEEQHEPEVELISTTTQLTLFDLPAASTLTETQEEYLRMLLYNELSIADIAQYAGTSERAVRAVVQRGIEALRSGGLPPTP